MSFRSISSAWLFLLALSSCGTISSLLYSRPAQEVTADDAKTQTEEEKQRLKRKYQSRYEWAVQHYESGDYKHSLQDFQYLSGVGALVESFDLIPFYLGMSRFHLEDCGAAVKALENFHHHGSRWEQEARMSQMRCYEKSREWKKIAATAAELENMQMNQNQRVLQKLFWAKALMELGESMGANVQLKDAALLLNNMPQDNELDANSLYFESWGRYYLVAISADLKSCLGQPVVEQKAGKKIKNLLWQNWLDGQNLCLEKATREALDHLLPSDSSMAGEGLNLLESATRDFVVKTKSLGSRLTLSTREQLKRRTQQIFYRLSSITEENQKNFQNQSFGIKNLERLKKHFDSLIMELSVPSSI